MKLVQTHHVSATVTVLVGAFDDCAYFLTQKTSTCLRSLQKFTLFMNQSSELSIIKLEPRTLVTTTILTNLTGFWVCRVTTIAGIAAEKPRITFNKTLLLWLIEFLSIRATKMSRFATAITVNHRSIISWNLRKTVLRLKTNLTIWFNLYIMLNFSKNFALRRALLLVIANEILF